MLYLTCYFQEHLGKGVIKAKASLVELDLSDNAFGPIGVQGLAKLIQSRSFYTLQELRLNNNGLGITGGKVRYDLIIYVYDFHRVNQFSILAVSQIASNVLRVQR